MAIGRNSDGGIQGHYDSITGRQADFVRGPQADSGDAAVQARRASAQAEVDAVLSKLATLSPAAVALLEARVGHLVGETRGTVNLLGDWRARYGLGTGA